MKRALPPALAALFLLAAAEGLAQDGGNPTIFERYARKLEKDPALDKLVQNPPAALQNLKWMVGTWDAVSTRYATASMKEAVQTGTRKTSFQLGGWWLASIDDVGRLKAASLITMDAYSQNWGRIFVSNWGAGLVRPMISEKGWDGQTIVFTGGVVLFNDPINMRLRISKASDDEYYEIWEEKITEDNSVPVFQLKLTRRKAAGASGK
jgi:hypothetical protein